MMPPLHIRPEARIEFDQAVDWYERQRAGWGAVFVERVQEVFSRIVAQPQWHGVIHRDVRQAVVKQFPYVVLYRETPEEIIVIAVVHTSRDPSVWQRRI